MLTRTEVERLLPAAEYVGLMEDAFVTLATGGTLPSRLAHLDSGPGEFHLKASGADDTVAVKIGACFYDRPATLGLESIVGVITLFDGRTGQPLLLMESATVTRLRTAATTAVAVRHLAAPDARTLAIIGTGGQAAAHVAAIRSVRPIDRVLVWSRDAAKAELFAAEHGCEVAPTVPTATRAADVVVTLTPSRTPLLRATHLRPGTLVAAVGSDAPDKRELHDDVLASAALVTDVTRQCLQVGELHHRPDTPVRAELGQVVAGLAPGRRSKEEIVVFDSTGTAVQDVAAARAIHAAARVAGVGTSLPLWD